MIKGCLQHRSTPFLFLSNLGHVSYMNELILILAFNRRLSRVEKVESSWHLVNFFFFLTCPHKGRGRGRGIRPYSSVVERQSCKLKVCSSILHGGIYVK
jgi:hypothetical protein